MGALELGFLSESDGSSLMDALKNPERYVVISPDALDFLGKSRPRSRYELQVRDAQHGSLCEGNRKYRT